MTRLRITVLERTFNREIAESYGSDAFKTGDSFGPCPRFEDGQGFLWDGAAPPPGFCPRAWADIHGEIRMVQSGGAHDFLKRPHAAISCCTDGIRPVVFRIERVRDPMGGGVHTSSAVP